MLDTDASGATDDGLDADGNYSHTGDLYRQGETLDAMTPRMLDHLRAAFPDYGFAPSRSVYAGGRSLVMKIVSGPTGLQDKDAGEAFRERVLTEMKRFEFSQGNVLSDYGVSSVSLRVEIDGRYHAQHAEIVQGTEVASRMSLAEFKRTIKAGDRIVLESTDSEYANSRGAVGVERTIAQVRSGDFIIAEGDRRIYCNFPKAGAFACDGTRFRIADARPERPSGYRLYRWIRS